jgi:ABC-type transport system substrate-binding protein
MTAARDKAKAASNLKVYEYPQLGFYDVRFNDRPNHLFGDEKVRLAFANALDKDSIVKAATDGTGATLWGDIPPASWAYDAASAPKIVKNVDKAKQLMKDAGWDCSGAPANPCTKAGKKFSAKFLVRAGKPQREKAVQIISEQVKAIGMDLQPSPTDFKVFSTSASRASDLPSTPMTTRS